MSARAGLLFYIWIPISLGGCEAVGPHSQSLHNLVTNFHHCMFVEYGRKWAETTVTKRSTHPGVSHKQTTRSDSTCLTLYSRYPVTCWDYCWTNRKTWQLHVDCVLTEWTPVLSEVTVSQSVPFIFSVPTTLLKKRKLLSCQDFETSIFSLKTICFKYCVSYPQWHTQMYLLWRVNMWSMCGYGLLKRLWLWLIKKSEIRGKAQLLA